MDIEKRKRTYWIVFLLLLFVLYVFADKGSSSKKATSTNNTTNNNTYNEKSGLDNTDTQSAMTNEDVDELLNSIAEDEENEQATQTDETLSYQDNNGQDIFE